MICSLNAAGQVKRMSFAPARAAVSTVLMISGTRAIGRSSSSAALSLRTRANISGMAITACTRQSPPGWFQSRQLRPFLHHQLHENSKQSKGCRSAPTADRAHVESARVTGRAVAKNQSDQVDPEHATDECKVMKPIVSNGRFQFLGACKP